MKIALASDIHTEFGNQKELVLTEDVDVLVLAGDIGKAEHAIEYGASFLDRAKDVVQIAGNHEFYNGKFDAVLEKMREAAANYEHLHFLDCDTVEISDHFFHGTTAWTDFSYGPDHQTLNMYNAKECMNDYRKITKFTGSIYRKLIPEDILAENAKARAFLFQVMHSYDRQKSIVVTHHAPCHLSIPDELIDERINHSYVNRWGEKIAHNGPLLWFHGHIHEPADYVIGDTRIISNAIGYPGQRPDSDFAIIEI